MQSAGYSHQNFGAIAREVLNIKSAFLSMVTPRLLYGYSMVTPWLLRGYSMVTPRLLYSYLLLIYCTEYTVNRHLIYVVLQSRHGQNQHFKLCIVFQDSRFVDLFSTVPDNIIILYYIIHPQYLSSISNCYDQLQTLGKCNNQFKILFRFKAHKREF